jgi:pyruvate dehydrogenase complex dehydrogenase (E1) component
MKQSTREQYKAHSQIVQKGLNESGLTLVFIARALCMSESQLRAVKAGKSSLNFKRLELFKRITKKPKVS